MDDMDRLDRIVVELELEGFICGHYVYGLKVLVLKASVIMNPHCHVIGIRDDYSANLFLLLQPMLLSFLSFMNLHDHLTS